MKVRRPRNMTGLGSGGPQSWRLPECWRPVAGSSGGLLSDRSVNAMRWCSLCLSKDSMRLTILCLFKLRRVPTGKPSAGSCFRDYENRKHNEV